MDRPYPNDAMINLLPGPVTVRAEVVDAFCRPPLSHRSSAYVAAVAAVAQTLSGLTGAGRVALLLGSGTLANDVCAAQLGLLGSPGLILTNGEFGRRLLDHARGARLSFTELSFPDGASFDCHAVIDWLDAHPETGWIWFVHCETATGILNPLERLVILSRTRDVRCCVDAISSLGTVPVELSGVYLASGVSGKGFASYPGLALVFYNHAVLPRPDTLPPYLDLGLMAARDGVPFTGSSNLLFALQAALASLDLEKRIQALACYAGSLRKALRRSGLKLIGTDEDVTPAVITIAVPPAVSSLQLGDRLRAEGFWLSYQSRYLVARNWVQICLLGMVDFDAVTPLAALLPRLIVALTAAEETEAA
jgi:aspartate aminotransferase-like enzyme